MALAESVAVESVASESVSATVSESVPGSSFTGASALLEEISAELDIAAAMLELDMMAELETGTTALEETATELEDFAVELDDALVLLLEIAGAWATLLELGAVTTASLDWAASASASNSAKRSRGWAKDWATKILATQAAKEKTNLRI